MDRSSRRGRSRSDQAPRHTGELSSLWEANTLYSSLHAPNFCCPLPDTFAQVPHPSQHVSTRLTPVEEEEPMVSRLYRARSCTHCLPLCLVIQLADGSPQNLSMQAHDTHESPGTRTPTPAQQQARHQHSEGQPEQVARPLRSLPRPSSQTLVSSQPSQQQRSTRRPAPSLVSLSLPSQTLN